VFLAGGLNAGNVAEAVAVVEPFGLDLCSGLRDDGRLSASRVAEFMQAVRGLAA
jgi:phosphoribosylanthranilate isomerase